MHSLYEILEITIKILTYVALIGLYFKLFKK